MTYWDVLAQLAWKSTAILGLALLIRSSFRHLGVRFRELVGTVALGSTALTALILGLPWLQLRVDIPAEVSAAVWSGAPTSVEGTHYDLAGAIWIGIGGVLILRLIYGLLALRTLRRRSTPVECAETRRVFERACATMGVSTQPELISGDAAHTLLTWGAWRPVIFLPSIFPSLSPTEQHMALCHELAHVRRHHAALRFLGEILGALIWFQPLWWLLLRRLRADQERVCDEGVLGSGALPSGYARLLLRFHQQTRADFPAVASGLEGEELEARIAAAVGIQSTPRRSLLLPCLLATLALIPLACVELGLEASWARRKARVLAMVGRPGSEAVLLNAMNDPAWQVREQAARGLAKVAPKKAADGDPAVPQLLRMLDDEHQQPREAAAHALGRRGGPGELSRVRRAAESDADRQVRDEASWALQRIARAEQR